MAAHSRKDPVEHLRRLEGPARPTAVLIGTAQTARLLAEMIDLAPRGPRLVGCVLVDGGSERHIAWKGDATRDATIGSPFLGTSLPVLGGIEELAELHGKHRFELAVVTLPAANLAETLRVRAALRGLGIPERFVPPLDEMLERSPVQATGMPRGEVDMVELIGRTPYGIDRRAVGRIIEGKRVLITGAGGSIGSELARIAATFRPELIVLMERSENALFEVDRQLGRRFPGVRRKAVLHDVVDEAATRRVVGELRPHAVFHAAAHKHVPLMEDHPSHAVTNNLFGTKSIADASIAAGAERFVMISSDKAVNPTSVMGATKRLAELYVQGLHREGRDAGTRLSMVRFGNVLGSACSVLPIWSQQLAEGGPLTVTDARMTRYFMTIHEAASLVLQAAAIEGGETSGRIHEHACAKPQACHTVYVLDMGEPVSILELAQRFARQHGFTPRVCADGVRGPAEGEGPLIEVVLTGARPGEKLHEELAYAAEQLRPTPYPGINAWAGGVHSGFDVEKMVAELGGARVMDDQAVLAAIRSHVPEMRRIDPEVEAKPAFSTGVRLGQAA